MNKAQKKTFVSWGDIAMDEDEEKLKEMHDPLKGDNRCWGDIQMDEDEEKLKEMHDPLKGDNRCWGDIAMEEDEKNKQEGWTVVKKKSKQ